jgi:hypothetical protein
VYPDSLAVCQLRISRQNAQTLSKLSEQALDTQQEFRVTIQELRVAFTEYLKNPSTLPDVRAVTQEIEEVCIHTDKISKLCENFNVLE